MATMGELEDRISLVARMSIEESNCSGGVTFKRYQDGSVMLSQNADLVYLSAEQFARLKAFMR